MFCPNCGNSVDDKAVFCPSCGANVTIGQTAPASTESPAQPEVQQFEFQTSEPIVPNIQTEPSFQPVPPMNIPPMPVYANQPNLKKGKYIKQLGSKKVKTLSIVVWAVFLAIAVVLGLSAYSFIGTSVLEIPAVAIVTDQLPDEAAGLVNDTDKLKDSLDKAEDELENFKDDISNKEYKTLKNFLRDAKKLADTPSISNAKTMLVRFDEIAKIVDEHTDNEEIKEIKEAVDSIDLGEDLNTYVQIIDFATYLLFGFAGFIVLLMLLATLIKSNGLTVTCLILSFPLCFFVAGPIHTILAVALFIAMIVMFCIINSEYKKYRKGV